MKIIITIILVVAAVAAAFWYLMAQKPAVPAVDMTVFNDATSVTYEATDGDVLEVAYVAEYAKVSGSGLDNEIMTNVPAASGSKYQNADGSAVLWNKGTEVTLYQNDQAVFTGEEVNENAVEENPVKTQLTANTWVWYQTVMSDGKKTTPTKTEAFTIVYDETDTVSGATDCNSFNGGYVLDGSKLVTGPLATTRMACGEDSQEQVFLNMISGSSTVFFTETGDLTLLLPMDSGSVMFKKQAAAAGDDVVAKLTSEIWVFEKTVMKNTSDNFAPTNPSKFSLTFKTDGSVGVTTDCNNGGGSYTVDGKNLQIGPNLAMTMMACEGSKESEFVSLITKPLVVADSPEGRLLLDLADGSGQIMFIYKQ